MIDIIISNAVGGEPAKVVRSTTTIQADTSDLQALRGAIDRALIGSPSVVETKSISGVEVRFIIDRIGPAMQRN